MSSKRGEAFKEGLDYLIDEYILTQPEVWKSKDDSLKVIGMAQVMGDLLSKAAPGSKVPALKVPGELMCYGKQKTAIKSLGRLGGRRNIIMFYAEGCNVCASEKEAIRELLSDRKMADGLRVYLVNVDKVLADNPSLASELFESFDLTSLPFILETDAKGTVLRRYVSFRF